MWTIVVNRRQGKTIVEHIPVHYDSPTNHGLTVSQTGQSIKKQIKTFNWFEKTYVTNHNYLGML